MNRSRKRMFVVAASLSMFVSGVGAFAAEQGQDLIVRNALDRPVNLVISDGELLHPLGNSKINAHWESILKGIQFEHAVSPLVLGVKIQDADHSTVELARCNATLSAISEKSKIAVVIYKFRDSKNPGCSIVDLSTVQASNIAPMHTAELRDYK